MVLVDTSVWIEVFRKSPTFRLETAVDFDEVVTCLPVVQEVLQGFRDEKAFALGYPPLTRHTLGGRGHRPFVADGAGPRSGLPLPPPGV